MSQVLVYNAPVNGAINACSDCSGDSCCAVIRPGGTIEPPFLTAADMASIMAETGLQPEVFSERKKNPSTGADIYFLKVDPGRRTGCMFMNEHNGRCGIYETRPVDCRLFPLDVKKFDSHYYWVCYEYTPCNLSRSDMEALMAERQKALACFAEELENYATFPLLGMEELKYEILGPIDKPTTMRLNKSITTAR